MVTDLLKNAHLYAGLGERIARGLAWVNEQDLANLPVGRHDIDGQKLYALVSEYTTKPHADARWEAHRRYLDLQCLASGRESIGYTPLVTLQSGQYIPEKDIVWLTGNGSHVVMEPGRFMLLWPGDGHMPGVALGEPEPVKKVVVKILV